MPWSVKKGGGTCAAGEWAVIKDSDGSTAGCHGSEADAKAQQAALYAKEGQRMTTEAPERPAADTNGKEPSWMARLRWRAVELDDMHIRAGDGRTVTAYAAVFDTPAEIHDQDGHYLEQNARSAFDKSLTERGDRISVFYHHGKTLYGTPSERGSVPLGRPLEVKPDGRGLLTVTRYNKTPLAEEILEAIKSGSLRGMSFTGAFLQSDPRPPYHRRADGDLTLVTRTEIALIEYGPTPTPAYETAEVVGVRTQEPERERIEVRDPDPEPDPQDDDAAAADAGTPAAPEEGTGAAAEGTEADSTTPEPPEHSEAPPQTRTAGSSEPPRRGDVAEQTPMTAAERAVRQGEIRERLKAIDTEYSGAELPAEIKTEWDDISEELGVHQRALDADAERKAFLRQIAEDEDAGERVDSPRHRSGYRTTPAAHVRQRPEDVYDLVALRQRARSVDDLPELYRDQAMRAVELARFPGAHSANFTREQAQTRIAELLDRGDHDLAERILVTGSPTYERGFWKYVTRGGFIGLTADEQGALSRALSMGSGTSAQVAVPFTLDPTVILTSDGATNPLRAISRVETITGRAWEGVTSAGITVARANEAAAASDNAPALAQPVVTPTRVQGFVPFSIEADQDWTQLRSEMTRLLGDAKDVEEATSFVTGNGTPPNPGGIATTLTTASNVNDGFTAFTADDLYAVDNALPPRFQPRARWLGRKNSYNLVRALDTNGTLYARLTEGRPPELLGYPAHEASAMPTRTTAGNRYLILGDWQQFIIVDKAGMNVELVPHIFDGANPTMPTGQRGLYAIWRNNSAVLVPNAFRGLTYAT
jgi:HK97 family phage major capsid protein/HK97 family phage prohead protease